MADGPPVVGDRDGGVCSRLSRRCRLAASILVAVGAGLLLIVALTSSWGLITAVVALIGGALVVGALPLARRATLWSATRGSPLPTSSIRRDGPTQPTGAPPDPQVTAPSVIAAGSSPPVWAARIGPPRPLSPGRPGTPVKRRLGAAVVPVHCADGPAPGGGALVVHARGDDVTLVDGDDVQIFPVGRRGVSPPATAGVPNPKSSERSVTTGRFVLLRESDGQAFLATTRLTDTW